MNGVLQDLGVAALSFLFGSGLDRWWNRARPLVMLQGFTDILKNRDDITCTKELSELLEKCWELQELQPGTVTLADIQTIRLRTHIVFDLYKKGLTQIDQFISALEGATTDDHVRTALYTYIVKRSVEMPLSLALKRTEVVCPQAAGGNAGSQKLTITESGDEKGCFRILWKGSTSTFSSNLNEQPFLKPRVEPFVDAMRQLDAPRIAQVLRALKPLLERQVQHMEGVRAIIEPIMDDSGRWTAKVLVANYGGAPMMIWPNAKMIVKHTSCHAKFVVDSYVAAEFPDDPKLRDIDSVHVLAPGDKIWFWIITKNIQKDITNGKILRAHYISKDARGSVRVKISRRGAFLGLRTSSNSSVFVESNIQTP